MFLLLYKSLLEVFPLSTEDSAQIGIQLLITLGTAFIASFQFWFWQSRFRPKVKISPQISKFEDNGVLSYAIKAINYTKKDIINVSAKLYLETPRTGIGLAEDEVLWDRKDIRLAEYHLEFFGRFNLKDEGIKYATRFVTREPIETSLINSKEVRGKSPRLLFYLHATHPESGIGEVISNTYEIKHIQDGEFESKDSFKIRLVQKPDESIISSEIPTSTETSQRITSEARWSILIVATFTLAYLTVEYLTSRLEKSK